MSEQPVTIAVACVAAAAQFLDGYTTYRGLYVKKVAVEGNKSGFTQWLSKAPWRLLTIKPAMCLALAGTAAIYNHFDPGTNFYSVLVVFALGPAIVLGIMAAVHNIKINKGL